MHLTPRQQDRDDAVGSGCEVRRLQALYAPCSRRRGRCFEGVHDKADRDRGESRRRGSHLRGVNSRRRRAEAGARRTSGHVGPVPSDHEEGDAVFASREGRQQLLLAARELA